jgi:DNA end-binding protein Ku
MAAPRANWKGFLKIESLTCPVALYTAVSTSDRIAFHTLNRATGHRVRRIYVDGETGEPVESKEQVKGYDLGSNDFIVLTPEEVASAVPDSDKTLSVDAFIALDSVDDVYFDKTYFLAPDGKPAHEAFTVIRDGMRAKKVVALARTVLFRRVRTVLVRPDDHGLLATTLKFDYEVRAADETFDVIPKRKIGKEMLDLARHIIETKQGKFDPSRFEDRYEAALADLVKAKLEGKPISRKPPEKTGKVVDLLEALRASAGSRKAAPPKRAAAKSAAASKRKTRVAQPRRKAS